eukprot:2591252-Alexandrium_andersonii.AAC.1
MADGSSSERESEPEEGAEAVDEGARSSGEAQAQDGAGAQSWQTSHLQSLGLRDDGSDRSEQALDA